MRLQSRHRRARGFTLIEVLAALVIFGIAIVGFIRAMGESAHIQGNLVTIQRAQMLAQNVIEEIRYSQSFEIGQQEGDFEGEDGAYHWSTDIEENPDTENLLDIVVAVTWNDGVEREYTLMSQIAQRKQQ